MLFLTFFFSFYRALCLSLYLSISIQKAWKLYTKSLKAMNINYDVHCFLYIWYFSPMIFLTNSEGFHVNLYIVSIVFPTRLLCWNFAMKSYLPNPYRQSYHTLKSNSSEEMLSCSNNYPHQFLDIVVHQLEF